MDVSNLLSGSSVFSKSSLNIWKFMVQVLLKTGLENFVDVVHISNVLHVYNGILLGHKEE